MSIDTIVRHVTPADGNIFLDLGFSPEEAAVLEAESLQVIAEKCQEVLRTRNGKTFAGKQADHPRADQDECDQ